MVGIRDVGVYVYMSEGKAELPALISIWCCGKLP